MGQVLYGCATTTETFRRAIQHSQESLKSRVKRYGINPKTIAKWRKRTSVTDRPTGPKQPSISVALYSSRVRVLRLPGERGAMLTMRG
jgi:transposase-like protein